MNGQGINNTYQYTKYKYQPIQHVSGASTTVLFQAINGQGINGQGYLPH
ncbi:MAG: hypothetical protein AAGC93_09400 [Cyanobacteria bacterium P01_F01_bin.53]